MAIQVLDGQCSGDDPQEEWNQFLRKARWKGIPRAEAEDLASETYEDGLRKKAKLLTLSLEDQNKYRWGIWRRNCADWFKQAARRQEVPQAPESQDELGGDDGERQSFFTRRQAFLACLDAYCTEDQRWTLHQDIEAIRARAPKSIQQGIDLLRQHCREGFSYEELAIEYNMLPETVRNRAWRASQYLKLKLRNE